MLQEMNLKDALKMFLKGKKVFSLRNKTSAPEESTYEFEPLEKKFEDVRFLVETPETKKNIVPEVKDLEAMNVEVKGVVAENMTVAPKKPKTSKSQKTKTNTTAKRLPANQATGKLDANAAEIMEKLKTGTNQGEIAEEYEVAKGTVSNWVRQEKAVEADEKCKTCQYRQTRKGWGNCDYIGITGHSRKGKAKDCNKYVKGEPLQKKRASSIYPSGSLEG